MSEPSLAVLDGMQLSAWWESRAVPRSTAFKLVKIAGIEPGKVRAEGSRSPVSFLDQGQVEALDALHRQLQNGATLAQLEGALTTLRRPEPAQDINPAPLPEEASAMAQAVLSRLKAGRLALETGLPLTTAEVGWLLGARPGGDSVARGRAIARRLARNVWTLEPSKDDSGHD
ncbi:hypothetical protein FB106_12034 [Synechococcus sp. Ace-Pa]|uniref:hypothetical protein n=1 Tax=Synechococcus sp. Ace-Pa TaxID=2572902 RepID=UPI0011A070BB|nr:hypothetical protein [Synechococcus sp. Ace-Pa]TWB87699.1 hypothetical protein FB106_12034 [Synechococcus sp. Ace-Pa]